MVARKRTKKTSAAARKQKRAKAAAAASAVVVAAEPVAPGAVVATVRDDVFSDTRDYPWAGTGALPPSGTPPPVGCAIGDGTCDVWLEFDEDDTTLDVHRAVVSQLPTLREAFRYDVVVKLIPEERDARAIRAIIEHLYCDTWCWTPSVYATWESALAVAAELAVLWPCDATEENDDGSPNDEQLREWMMVSLLRFVYEHARYSDDQAPVIAALKAVQHDIDYDLVHALMAELALPVARRCLRTMPPILYEALPVEAVREVADSMARYLRDWATDEACSGEAFDDLRRALGEEADDRKGEDVARRWASGVVRALLTLSNGAEMEIDGTWRCAFVLGRRRRRQSCRNLFPARGTGSRSRRAWSSTRPCHRTRTPNGTDWWTGCARWLNPTIRCCTFRP